MKRLVLSNRAVADLGQIWDYSAEQWSVMQADSYIGVIKQACQDVLEGRRIGQTADHIKAGHNKCHVASHTLYFRINGDDLIIVRILHQSMEPGTHL
ncbi:type II toxin-antitoxin system RelE/ParE family toxin [Asticcacaulis sp. EMRT-3]|uniref:type II toxin-antitoxin system RelE/ParE family toxin n=1 Tax=Asticcacaulis sp. EMRT-3 TaxID=3040349 RepID=UPI0024AF0BA4|nr:type II toxin-antitoxin system RelE/ParE family toxin [Asticcacaulis sp. EMRT-3]MDI7776030.1 type II toxin-antitoxin system RelE/ParE family toxin [Asticcacaulis sp. EMRT-3]